VHLCKVIAVGSVNCATIYMGVSGNMQQDDVLSQAGPRDAAVNFRTYRSLQRHAVFTAIATLSN